MEFASNSITEPRIRRRIVGMARAWETGPGDAVSVVFPGKPEKKAVYRLLSNPRSHVNDLLESHRTATGQRCRDEDTALAIQDTTMLNCSGLAESVGGLSKIGGGGSGSYGIAAHVTLAVSASGRALGVLEINADFRERVNR